MASLLFAPKIQFYSLGNFLEPFPINEAVKIFPMSQFDWTQYYAEEL